MRVIAFQNSDNDSQYRVTKDDVEFDLDAAGVTKIEVVENGQSITSETDDVSFSGSLINVKWGQLEAPGRSNPTIYAYSDAYPKGKVIFGPGLSTSIMLEMQPDERPASE